MSRQYPQSSTSALRVSRPLGACTVPAKLFEQWAKEGMALPGDDFAYKPVGAEIPYEELNLEQPWEQLNIEHELTRKGIQKFVSD